MNLFGAEFADRLLSAKAWPVRTFGSLVDEFRYGTSNKSEDFGLPTLRIPNVVGGVLDLSDLKSVPVSAADENRLRLVDGDLLFVRTNGNVANVGRCAVFSQGAVSASGLPTDRFIYASYLIRARVRPDKVVPAFVGEFMRSPAGRAQLRTNSKTSAGQYNVNIEGLSGIRIPLPPIDTQQAIVDVLQQAEFARQVRQKSSMLLNELSGALFEDMFGSLIHSTDSGVRVPLGSLLENIESGYSPRCLARAAVGEEWGVLKLGAITTCEYVPAENKALPATDIPRVAHEVKVGDLLFSRKNTRDLVGAAVLVKHTQGHLLLPDLIFRLVVKRSAAIDKRYLHRLLIHPRKRREIRRQASGSAASMPNISKERLSRVSIELPPLARQREFGDMVDVIESMASTQHAHLAQLDGLFFSLQHCAFAGEL